MSATLDYERCNITGEGGRIPHPRGSVGVIVRWRSSSAM